MVPHDQVVVTAQRLGADIASNDDEAVARIYRTYREGSLVAGAEAWAVEGRAAGEWQAGAREPADFEARRQAVTERGRTQVS